MLPTSATGNTPLDQRTPFLIKLINDEDFDVQKIYSDTI